MYPCKGGNTAALTFNHVPLQKEWILAQDAQDFLAENRPAFLGYQFGLALGLAEKSLEEVEANLSVRSILREEWGGASGCSDCGSRNSSIEVFSSLVIC